MQFGCLRWPPVPRTSTYAQPELPYRCVWRNRIHNTVSSMNETDDDPHHDKWSEQRPHSLILLLYVYIMFFLQLGTLVQVLLGCGPAGNLRVMGGSTGGMHSGFFRAPPSLPKHQTGHSTPRAGVAAHVRCTECSGRDGGLPGW